MSVGGRCFDGAMSMSTPGHQHPLLTAVRAAEAALDEVAGVDPLFASVEEKSRLLVELTKTIGRLTALRAQVLAVGQDLAVESGTRDSATWLAVETRTSRREAVHDARLGVAVRDRWPVVGEAVVAGRITWEQAGVLVHALDELPMIWIRSSGRRLRRIWSPRPDTSTPSRYAGSAGRCWKSWHPTWPTTTKPERCSRRRPGPESPPGCRSGPGGTGPPTSTPGSPTRWPPDCGCTWMPTPHPAGSPSTVMSTGSP